ncbi:putative membrane-bound spermidine synthase [Rhodobium orientis]|nr:fused MFS/spermidine synthase [Rhodobium orientis]MBB4301947.1 putative membrane-bound spermidine synthase [Rhodobium orientis]
MEEHDAPEVRDENGPSGAGLMVLLVAAEFLVSAAGLVVEIVAGRMLAPYVGMSLYSWTAVIAVVLAGLTIGHWVGGRLAEREERAIALGIAAALALAAVATALALPLLQALSGPILGSAGTSVLGLVVLAAVLFLVPSFMVGVPAPALTKIAIDRAPHAAGRALGRMYAAGALGAIAGTLLAGYLFISWLGTARTLAVVAAVDAGLALVFLGYAGRRRGRTAVAILVAMALSAAAAGLASAKSPCTVESDYYCIRSIDITGDVGTEARLMVLDHLGHGINVRDDPRRLVTPYVATIDHLRRLRFGAHPVSAFFIGGGAYTLPRAWTEGPSPDLVTVAEIDPAVTEIAVSDFWLDPEKMAIHHHDARRVLSNSGGDFDIVVGDAFTDIAVPPHLVTKEFFALVAERLNDGGVYMMNLVDRMERLHALAAVHRTLKEIFPVVEVWVEAEDFSAGGRTTFVLLAARTPTDEARVVEPSTGRIFARIPPDRVARLVAEHDPPVLTDDYAPIDRLMGALSW